MSVIYFIYYFALHVILVTILYMEQTTALQRMRPPIYLCRKSYIGAQPIVTCLYVFYGCFWTITAESRVFPNWSFTEKVGRP